MKLAVPGASQTFWPRPERKLTLLDAAATLSALRVPPGNRLETLRGDLADTYSIRVNNQWRICFSWTLDGPADVRIIDYH